MNYPAQPTHLKVRATDANLAEIRAAIGAPDQRAEVVPGQTISHFRLTHEGGKPGDLTIYHDSQRAAICFDGYSDWGEWNDDSRELYTERGETYICDRDYVAEPESIG
jgi:hypothetical protein